MGHFPMSDDNIVKPTDERDLIQRINRVLGANVDQKD